MNFIKKTGVILCGGKSRRMGIDKGSLIIKNKMFISYAIDALERFEEIILATDRIERHDYLEIVSKEKERIKIIEDIYPEKGPISGIYTAMKSAKYDMVVIACDMPFISRNLTENIAGRLDESDEKYNVILFSDKRIQPLCSGYRKIYKDEINRCIMENKLSLADFIKNNKYILFEETNKTYVKNINYPEEYRKLDGR